MITPKDPHPDRAVAIMTAPQRCRRDHRVRQEPVTDDTIRLGYFLWTGYELCVGAGVLGSSGKPKAAPGQGLNSCLASVSGICALSAETRSAVTWANPTGRGQQIGSGTERRVLGDH